MKSAGLISLFFLIAGLCNAQHISVANDKENILYVGISNPLTIVAENCPCNMLVVKTSNGKIIGSNCSYMFQGEQAGKAEITVYKKEGGKLKRIGKSDFWVKSIPLPVFCIGSYCNTGVTRAKKNAIAAQEFVRAELLNFGFDAKFQIDSFNVKIISNDTCKAQQFVNKTGLISKEIRDAFSQLKENDVIIFSGIIVIGPDGIKREIAPFTMSVY
jgi:GldM C-terminal domain